MVSDRLQAVRAALADRYDVEQQLGRGGMAAVFLAERIPDRQRVAVKVLHPEISISVGAARFNREIQLMARLRHPHILPLLESDSAGGLLFYAMPFAEGGSLQERLRSPDRLQLDEVFDITRQVASALDHAHSQNVIHRDVKPGNILFHQGSATVSDFGMARAVESAGGEHLSSSGIIIGTPVYMSPEQAAGEPQVGKPSDIYSLGCVVYEMLVGEPPFTGRSEQAIRAKHIGEQPPSLHVVRPDLSPQVEVAVHQALAKKPADRPASVGAFAEMLAAG